MSLTAMPLTTMPTVTRLDLATVTLPDWHPEAADGLCAVYGYVIHHPDGPIVIDTGVGRGHALIDEMYQPDSQPLDAALSALDINPGSVVGVVNSHLHFDHCGQNPLWYGTDVPYYLQRSEIAAVEDDPRYTVTEWALPPVEQRQLLDGDREIAEGVTVLATPGHTEGHQSVLIEAADDRIVIAGQAVWRQREFVDQIATDANVGSEELRPAALDSIRRIRSLEASIVHFSHCPAYHHSDPT